MPPGHPIIPLKSNLFNVAAVSVKRSIARGSSARGAPLLRERVPYQFIDQRVIQMRIDICYL